MGRKKKHRNCRFLRNERIYKPIGKPMVDLAVNELGADEFEAVRICDFEKKSQIEAAQIMNISRGTVQRLLSSGRYKLIDSILNERAIKLNNINK